MTEGSDTTLSGTTLECPGCGYETVVYDDDGHIPICPDCSIDGLMPPETAEKVKGNRMEKSGKFDDAVTADFDDVAGKTGVQTVEMDMSVDVATADSTLNREALTEMIEEARQDAYKPRGHYSGVWLSPGDDRE